MMSWITVACIASMFMGRLLNGTTVPWTMDSNNPPLVKYMMLAPDTMLIDFSIQNTMVSGIPLQLMMQVPGGYKIADYSNSTMEWWENGYGSAGIGRLAADPRDINYLRMTKIPSYTPSQPTNNTWLPSLNAGNGTYVMGQLIFRVSK